MRNNTMKAKTVIFFVLVFSFAIPGCEKDIQPEKNDMVPDALLSNNYKGTLKVQTINTYPEWDEIAQVEVAIDKELGIVTFGNTTLTYSGVTISGGKIERSGSWKIAPTGRLEEEDGTIYVQVDAGVTVINDEQKIYAMDDKGNWILVNSTTINAQPDSDLTFNLDEAVTGGSKISAKSDVAALIWTLSLSVGLK